MGGHSLSANLDKLTGQLNAQGTPAFFINGEQWQPPQLPADTTPIQKQQKMAAAFQQALSDASRS